MESILKNAFFSTEIALGSSAIVKISGHNCFRTLYGSRLPKGSAVPPRFHQVSPRLRKFRDRFSPSSFNFFASFWTELALGSSAIVKVLGHNDIFFRGSLQQMAFASQKVLWSVPQTVLYPCLRVSRSFWGKWLLLQKRFCGGFPQLFSTLVSQMAVTS